MKRLTGPVVPSTLTGGTEATEGSQMENGQVRQPRPLAEQRAYPQLPNIHAHGE